MSPAKRGKTGRRALPTAVKAARGEQRAARLNPREPRPSLGSPAKPQWFGDAASAEWDRLVELTSGMKVLTVADGPALEATVAAFEEMSECRAVVEREGRFHSVTTTSGDRMVRAHPALRVGAEAWRRYVMGLALFGLSPAMRTKVQAVPERERDDVELWLIDGGKGKRA